MIRHFGAVWKWPDHHGCTDATLGVEVGICTGVTFGMAVGVETGTAGFGSGVMGGTDCVLIEWLWQAMTQIWETWCEPAPMWLIGSWAQCHCI